MGSDPGNLSQPHFCLGTGARSSLPSLKGCPWTRPPFLGNVRLCTQQRDVRRAQTGWGRESPGNRGPCRRDSPRTPA